ncbi:hypothetical protein GEMRC1_008798 [Eukaryota sp. GEM-RC1]
MVLRKRESLLKEAATLSVKHRNNAEGIRKKLFLVERKREVLQEQFNEHDEISAEKLKILNNLIDVTVMMEEKERQLQELQKQHKLNKSLLLQEHADFEYRLKSLESEISFLQGEIDEEEMILSSEQEQSAMESSGRSSELALLSEEFSRSVEHSLETFVSENSEMFGKLRKQYGDGVAVHMIQEYCLSQKQRHLIEVEQRMEKFKKIQIARDDINQLVKKKEEWLMNVRSDLSNCSVKIQELSSGVENQRTLIDNLERDIEEINQNIENFKYIFASEKQGFGEECQMYQNDLLSFKVDLDERFSLKKRAQIAAQNEHFATSAEEDVILEKLKQEVVKLLDVQSNLIDTNVQKEAEIHDRISSLNLEIEPELVNVINEHVAADKKCVSLYCSWVTSVWLLNSTNDFINEQIPNVQRNLENSWTDLDFKISQLKIEAQTKRRQLSEQAEKLRLEILSEAENFATNPLLGASFLDSPTRKKKETVSYSDLLRGLPTCTTELVLPPMAPIRRENLNFSRFSVSAGPVSVPDRVLVRAELLLRQDRHSEISLPDWAFSLPAFLDNSSFL